MDPLWKRGGGMWLSLGKSEILELQRGKKWFLVCPDLVFYIHFHWSEVAPPSLQSDLSPLSYPIT